MSLLVYSLTQQLRETIQISRSPSQITLPFHITTTTDSPANMSERTPLLSGSVNGPSTASLPSRRDVENALPSKEERIRVAEALGALEAGKLPYVSPLPFALP